MANWSAMKLTANGSALLAKAQANKSNIEITGIGIGSGTPTETKLGTLRYTLGVQSIAVSSADKTLTTVVSEAVSNADKDGGFDVKELGIYAKNGSSTILYAYCTDSAPDGFPIYNGMNPVTLQFTLHLKISGTESFTATISTAGSVTTQTVTTMIEAHNGLENAHTDFSGASASAAGVRGFVPAPAKGAQNKVLKGDGTWSDTAPVAGKLGTTTVGSGINPIYLKSGVATASASSVGSGAKPIYMNSGTLTASAETIGNGTNPLYMKSGVLTASASTVGGDDTPIYLKSGVLTACAKSLTDIADSLLEENGYIKFGNGLTLQWGNATTNVVTNFPRAFTTRFTFNWQINSYINWYDARSEITTLSNSQFCVASRNSDDTYAVSWFAIGLS